METSRIILDHSPAIPVYPTLAHQTDYNFRELEIWQSFEAFTDCVDVEYPTSSASFSDVWPAEWQVVWKRTSLVFNVLLIYYRKILE